jgi:choline dehydrogenase
MMANPEYIVVGSGAGGGPLAARLAELGHRVLLLEAGGEDKPWTYQVPVLHGLATEDEAMRLDHYVRHYADEARQEQDPKYERARNGVLYPRARTLGGCTAHYAMIIIRPHDSDWQTIRDATGDASWAPSRMNEYFRRVERCLYREGPGGGHGTDGWLPTRFPDVFNLASRALVEHDLKIGQIVFEAIDTAKLHPINHGIPDLSDLLMAAAKLRPSGLLDLGKAQLDPNALIDPNDLGVLGRREIGFLAVPTAIDKEGRRAGTRERIRAAQRTGLLELRLHTHVTGLVFDPRDKRRVIGVRCLPGPRLYRADRNAARFGSPRGTEETVLADREVILSAGAFITPQLLMLSGIGPEPELTSLGIEVRQHVPGVGANLQDRYEVGIVGQAREPFGLLSKATFKGPAADQATGDPLFEEWRSGTGKGLYATNGAVLGFIARSSVAEHDEPDLFVFGVPGAFVGYSTGWSSAAVARPYDKWTWLLLKAHTRARGRVRLRTNDPLDPPDVDFNYFERDASGALTSGAAADLKAMREGVRFVKRLIDDAATVLKLHPTIMQGLDLETDGGIDAFVQGRAWGHHASCTCRIGGDGDPDAVLDSSFRVRGVKGLRVVDASVFPKIPGFFVVMPTYMISEKAAEVIHAQAQAAP